MYCVILPLSGTTLLRAGNHVGNSWTKLVKELAIYPTEVEAKKVTVNFTSREVIPYNDAVKICKEQT